MIDFDLIILQPPSDRSKRFQNYCVENNHPKEEFTSYVEFLKDILTRLFVLTKNDGLCCLIFPNNLTSDSTIVYAHIVSMGVTSPTWKLNDEIILMTESKKSFGKIAVLKKGDFVETMSRAERLTYISIPEEEKEAITESVWIINHSKDDFIDERAIKWLILSYSNPGEKIHDPFPDLTNSKRICLTMKRKFTESVDK